MERITKTAQMKAWSEGVRAQGLRLGFVPTMGYLHEGHLSLVRQAQKVCERTVVSIFVNPKQFGPKEDLAVYPRDLERDLGLLEGLGVDAVFCPEAEEIYPPGFQTRVEVTELSAGLCGEFRPDFFPGVVTVVLKLFNITRPHAAVFGEKDFQQLAVVRRMAKDLHLDTEVLSGPTVREVDGLAMSSRNAYLSAEERPAALGLSQALELANSLARSGEREAQKILAEVWRHIEATPPAKVQYAELVDPDTLKPVSRLEGRAQLVLAVFVGRTRLIDNGAVTSE